MGVKADLLRPGGRSFKRSKLSPSSEIAFDSWEQFGGLRTTSSLPLVMEPQDQPAMFKISAIP